MRDGRFSFALGDRGKVPQNGGQALKSAGRSPKGGVLLLLSQVLFCLSHRVLGMLARTPSGPMPIGRRECVLYALNAGMRQWGSYGAGTVTTRLKKRKDWLWMNSKASPWLKCCYRFNLHVQLAAMQGSCEG